MDGRVGEKNEDLRASRFCQVFMFKELSDHVKEFSVLVRGSHVVVRGSHNHNKPFQNMKINKINTYVKIVTK